MKIPLTRGLFAQVDEADAALLMPYRWHASSRRPHGVFYAQGRLAGKRGKIVRMHRLLLDFPALEVDHINGDTLDNRRANLRPANKRQQAGNSRADRNGHSTSRFKGVSWWTNRRLRSGGYWKAAIAIDRKTTVKYRKTEIEAAKAYNEMARQHFGEFARLNVIAEAS